MTKRLGIAAVFLVGCAVGGGAGQLVVPKASAQQAATLPASEYLCLQRASDPKELTYEANKLAAQRWELAGGVSPAGVWCWKRPKM